MLESKDDVFKWLAEHTGERFFYVLLKAPAWIEYKAHLLDVFVDLGRRLETNSELVRQLIRDNNWRYGMFGNVLAILQGDATFAIDMAWRIAQWSWAAPQLAAGFAILSDGTVTTPLEDCLEVATEESCPKTVLSAYAALKLIGHTKATDFEKTPLIEHLQSLEWENWISWADNYWQVWKKYKGLCTVENG